jgi:hypothetical protein
VQCLPGGRWECGSLCGRVSLSSCLSKALAAGVCGGLRRALRASRPDVCVMRVCCSRMFSQCFTLLAAAAAPISSKQAVRPRPVPRAALAMLSFRARLQRSRANRMYDMKAGCRLGALSMRASEWGLAAGDARLFSSCLRTIGAHLFNDHRTPSA